MFKKKREVNEYRIKEILREFIDNITSVTIMLHFDVTRDGVVHIYTNRPGLLIGKGGKDINMLEGRMVIECNAKCVKLHEIKNTLVNVDVVASNKMRKDGEMVCK